ncbi:MAG: diacylglycerol kinase family protein [Polyangiales bacterium]
MDRVAVVVNGNAKHVTDELVASLDQIVRSGDLYVSRTLQEGQEIARRVVEKNYPVVLTGGGDGSFVQMVTWIVRAAEAVGKTPPRFGLLKLGTGNALAWVLGANDPKKRGLITDLQRVQQTGEHTTMPVLEVGGYLTPFAGAGGDALATTHYNQVRDTLGRFPILRRYSTGLVAYGISISMLTSPHLLLNPKMRVTITNEGEDAFRIADDGQCKDAPFRKGDVLFDGPTNAVFGSTIPYWGFGARIFPFASDREDRFQLRIVSIGPADVALGLRRIWKGTYRSPRVLDFFAQDVRLTFAVATPVEVGGDAIGSFDEIRMRLYPTPIHVVNHYAPPRVDAAGS